MVHSLFLYPTENEFDVAPIQRHIEAKPDVFLDPLGTPTYIVCGGPEAVDIRREKRIERPDRFPYSVLVTIQPDVINVVQEYGVEYDLRSARDFVRWVYFKALELSKTGFPEEQQLAHIDHAGTFAGNHALAAVLLMEGRFNEALGLLDELIATADSAHSGLPKTLRLLVHAAMDRPDLVSAEFDAQSLAAAEHWPDMGYRYWFVVRNCSNAFFVSTASEVLARAQGILAASAPAH